MATCNCTGACRRPPFQCRAPSYPEPFIITFTGMDTGDGEGDCTGFIRTEVIDGALVRTIHVERSA